MASVEKVYVSVNEAVKMGYGSDASLYNLINEGVLPAYRIGERMTRIKISDLEAMMRPVVPRGKKVCDEVV